MSDTKHTLPAELEFDIENHGNKGRVIALDGIEVPE